MTGLATRLASRERAAAGRAARKRVPPSALAGFSPAGSRADRSHFLRKDRAAVDLAAACGYRKAMAGFALLRELDVWYSHAAVDEPPTGSAPWRRRRAGGTACRRTGNSPP